MRRLRITSRSVTALLMILLGLLLLLAAAGWLLPSAEAPRIPAPMSYQMPLDLAEGVATAEEMQQVLERPLFWKERRPLPPALAAEGAVPVASADGLRVVGVIVRDNVQTALLVTGQGVERARIGDTVAGWRVESVSANSVRLVSAERTVDLDVVQPRSERIRLEPANR